MTAKKPAEDYKMFLSSGNSQTVKVTPDLSKITQDLVSSPWHIVAWYLGFSVIGYFVSLLICAQNSLGLSGFAHHVAKAIHQLPYPWCPLICGAVFTGVPFFFTAFFLSRFQHRYLIFKMWWFFAAVPIFGTVSMILLPQNFQHHKLAHSMNETASGAHVFSDISWMAVWAISAIIFPYIFELVVWQFVAPKKRTIVN
jgi:hypothetical protein